MELRPGALGDLRVFLASYGPAIPPPIIPTTILRPENAPSFPDREVQLSWGARVRLLMYPGVNAGLTLSELISGTGGGEGSIGRIPSCDSGAARSSQQSGIRHRYLLACVPFMKWGFKLQQPDVCNILSDRDFFQLLRKTYTENRLRDPAKWLRTVSKLDFARVSLP